MMHVCVFPILTNPSPIYGFDVIAGKNKMTGAFHDFSPSAYRIHPMLNLYFDSVRDFVPNKQRELPDWAKRIFTDKMLAAGNVNTDEEAQQIIDIAVANLRMYMEEVGKYDDYLDGDGVKVAQNHYCNHQKQNPHTPKVMKSLGLDEAMVDTFCKDMLFPNIE
jgi:phycocyanobilin:ferredoxin oxidoreductase